MTATILQFKPRPRLNGFCILCSAPSVRREDHVDGLDTCARGHTYPTCQALPAPHEKDGAA